MNKIKFFISSLLALTFLVSSGLSFAQESATNQQVGASPSNLVAMVDIKDAKIVSQTGNVFNISFTITNGTGLQGGVKYGIQLVPEGASYIAHETVYDESLTLLENSETKKDIIYTAPSILSGNYTLILNSKNESNFPFGTAILGKAKLVASTKGVKIANDSCYLQVQGEKSGVKYKINESVDIKMAENLVLTCTAMNNADSALTLTPFYETRNFNSFGKVIPQQGGDYNPVSFKKGEQKTFSVLLPKGNKADFYGLTFALMGEGSFSNYVYINYIINGVNAEIKKISLDKDYYAIGDEGQMRVIWSMLPTSYKRGGNISSNNSNIVFEADIVNENGSKCAPSIKEELKKDPKNPESVIDIKFRNNCLNPKVSAVLKDTNGNVLNARDFSFTSSEGNVNPSNRNTIIIIVVLVLLMFVGWRVYSKKKNINTNA